MGASVPRYEANVCALADRAASGQEHAALSLDGNAISGAREDLNNSTSGINKGELSFQAIRKKMCQY